jgi:RDD family protein
MSSESTIVDAPPPLPRAGFWRRLLSLAIDGIIVLLPFQVLAAVLFAVTAGNVQMYGGVTFTNCLNGKDIPQALDPPPPHDSNFIRVCRTSFFGAPVGATLTVGRNSQEGSMTTTVTQTYMLDKEGTPISGHSIDWIAQLALLAYLIGMVWKTGRTFGARVVRVKVIDTANPSSPGVPLGKATLRYLAILIGAVPALALLAYRRAVTGGSADAMFTADFFQWYAIAGLIGVAWAFVLIVQVAKKTDPVYDRLAGTAALKV